MSGPSLAYPSTAVVVVNWNGFDDTAECVASLLAVDYPHLRILVVDNGSTDGSAVRLRAEFPTIQLLEVGQNRGFAEGCNIAMRLALEMGVSYVWLVNNDAVAEPGALRKLVDLAEVRPDVRFFGSWVTFYDSPDKIWFGGGTFGRLTGRRGVQLWNQPLSRADAVGTAITTDWMTGCNLLVRARDIAHDGLMDESYFLYSEELEWQIRTANGHPSAVVLCEPLMRHKGGRSTGGDDGYLAPLFMSRNFLKMAKTHAGWAWPLWMLTWCTDFVLRPLARGRWRVARAALRGATLQRVDGAEIMTRVGARAQSAAGGTPGFRR